MGVAPCIPRTVVVGVVGLLGTVLVAHPLGHGLGGIGSLALAVPHDGLLNCPRRWVSRPVGVELGVIACGVVSESSVPVLCAATYPAARKCSAVVISILKLSTVVQAFSQPSMEGAKPDLMVG